MNTKHTYLMTPRQRETLLAELREEELSECYEFAPVTHSRPRFSFSGIPEELFESFSAE